MNCSRSPDPIADGHTSSPPLRYLALPGNCPGSDEVHFRSREVSPGCRSVAAVAGDEFQKESSVLEDGKSFSEEGESSRSKELSKEAESFKREESSRRSETSNRFSCGHSVSNAVINPAERVMEKRKCIGFELESRRRNLTLEKPRRRAWEEVEYRKQALDKEKSKYNQSRARDGKEGWHASPKFRLDQYEFLFTLITGRDSRTPVGCSELALC